MKNLQRSSRYRRYDSKVPEYLIDRPEDLVITCMARLETDILPQQVMHLRDQYYKVKDYEVFLGDNSTYPKCSCFQWQHSCYPCKHMFAVFKHTSALFCDLSEKYLQLPYLKLDNFITATLATTDNQLVQSSVFSTDNVEEQNTEESPETSTPKDESEQGSIAHEASLCREYLKVLTTYSYQLENIAHANEMKEALEKLVIRCRNLVPRDSNNHLPCNSVLKNKKRAVNSSVFTDPPPNKKRKSNKYTGRVGAKAELMKTNYLVSNLLLKVAKEKLNSAKKISQKKNTQPSYGAKVLALAKVSRSIEVETTPPTQSPVVQRFVDMIDADMCERVAQQDYWLTDIEVNCAINLLKLQFPGIPIQDPIFGQRHGVHLFEKADDIFQILHDPERQHWVAVSNRGALKEVTSASDVVFLYDSMKSRMMNKAMQKQIASKYITHSC